MLKNIKIRHFFAMLLALLAIAVIINSAARSIFPLKYKEYVIKYSAENRIDPFLVYAIMKAESSFNPQATSPKSARGLMQITDETGKWIAGKMEMEAFEIENLYQPEINISIGCWYVRNLMDQFGNKPDLVIAAYNAGRGNVSQWLKDKDYSKSGRSLDRIPFKETDRFVKRVKNYYSIYKKLYQDKL